MGALYVYQRFFYEKDRWMMWQRKENIKDMPAHHFSNRGGVLLEKQFVGFVKYYENDKAMMDWYAKAYPRYF